MVVVVVHDPFVHVVFVVVFVVEPVPASGLDGSGVFVLVLDELEESGETQTTWPLTVPKAMPCCTHLVLGSSGGAPLDVFVVHVDPADDPAVADHMPPRPTEILML